MIEELKDGILEKGLALTGFDSSNFEYDKIRTDDKRPYCTFFSFPTVYDFDSANTYQTTLIQFEIWGNDDELSTVHSMAATLLSAFDFCTDISMDNYNLVSCVRDSYYVNRHLKVWQVIITYKIEIEKARS